MAVPPVFEYLEAILFWVIFAWVFIPEILLTLKGPHPSSSQDAGTFRLIDTASDVALFLAFVLAFLPGFAVPYPRLALYVGSGFLLAGGLLRRSCFRALGRYFTAIVTVLPEQPVIDTGPYRWIRHPGYTAAFVIYFGLGLALGSWLSLAVLFLTACLVYNRRVQAEEKALLNTLGEPYRAYMRRTKRFIPFLF